MASLHNSALVSGSIGGLRRPSAGVDALLPISVAPRRHLHSNTHLDLRLKRDVRVVAKKRWSRVFASSSSSSSSNTKDGSNQTDDDNSRPSLLNILAGFVVFLFAGCLMLYLSSWVIWLIFNPPPFN